MLDMGDAHAYLYGDWLFEKEVPSRDIGQDPWDVSLQLTPDVAAGSPPLVPGTNDLDPSKNVIFNLPSKPYTSDQSVRAILHLPRPQKIHYAISGCILSTALKGTKEDIAKLKQIPDRIFAVRIFQYCVNDLRDALLVPTNSDDLGLNDLELILWQPPQKIVEIGSKKIAILHIYDEPAESSDIAQDREHSLAEFNKSLQQFLKIEVELTDVSTPDNCDDPLPELLGLLPEELRPLDERKQDVLALLNENRGGSAREIPSGGSGGPVCSGAHASILKSPSAPESS
jgi:hypothetical protein